MAHSYIDAITLGFPTIVAHANGDPFTYENIVWESGPVLPSKETLDLWIASNPHNPDKRITVLAFRNRFTKNEKITIELASIDNPAASQQSRGLSASIRVDLRDSDNARFIDLDRQETRDGVIAMETYGLIGVGRATVILDTAVLGLERPLDRELQ